MTFEIRPCTPTEAIHIRHHVRLPSGKQIEVVYRDQGQPTAPEEQRDATGVVPVCPIRYTSASIAPASWRIRSTGPRKVHGTGASCCVALSARRAARAYSSRQAVEQLDEQLDHATGALLSDLKQLTQANMEDEVEFFIRALDADLIVPSDF